MKKKPLNAFGDWFYYSFSERKATFLICAIILVLSLFPFAYDHFIRPKPKLVVREQLINQLEHSNTNKLSPKIHYRSKAKKHINQATWSDLVVKGIQHKTASSFINYRKALNGFKSTEQIEKTYGLTQEEFTILQHHFILPAKPRVKEKNNLITHPVTDFAEVEQITIVNINEADSSEFMKLPGIGPYYTAKILRFRNALGGFYSIEQLRQVKGLPDTILIKMLPFIMCAGGIKQINVNKAELHELARNPYISWKQARLIIAYRTQHGIYEYPNQVKKAALFSQEQMDNIERYLSF